MVLFRGGLSPNAELGEKASRRTDFFDAKDALSVERAKESFPRMAGGTEDHT